MTGWQCKINCQTVLEEKSSAAREIFRHGVFFGPGLAVVALAFVFAATISWRRWPDLLVDFGGQRDMPWRIAHGAVLYRDLFYFDGGPSSQYFNATALGKFSALSAPNAWSWPT